MRITVAENAGFCFGVKRAADTVFSLTEQPDGAGRIYTVGSLIHNPHITAELARRGVRVIEPDDIASVCTSAVKENRATVVIRTHGIPKAISERLYACEASNPFFTVCDMTCPYVKKIHNIVSENRGRQLILFGDAGHPEVQGIISYSDTQPLIFGSYDEIQSLETTDLPVIAVAQTTQSTDEWKKCQKFIKKVCTNAIIFDTICKVTEMRQSEADELSRKVDLMIVIGGRDSSNSRKLYQTAKKNLDNTFFVESASELPLTEVTPYIKVGITAGASTPGGIIQEVTKLMSELEAKTIETEEEDFAGMLENSLKTLNTGETVVGIITSVSAGELHVDLGTKVTGIIPADEVSDDTSVKLADMFNPGDEIEAIVVKVSDRDGVATLSKKRIDNKLRWRKVLDAYKNDTTIEGKIVDVIKGGVLLDYDSNKLFVPASQTGVSKDGDLNTILGTTKKAKIIEINEGRKRAVASIRKVESENRKNREADFWANVEAGKQYEGEVKSLTSYGAFVDLGGVDGMVHSSELSWTHIKQPSDVVSIGQVISVYVKDFNPETKRISLGYKTEETNPWNVFSAKFAIGDVVPVKIVSLMPFGAFAEVVPGADGLIHISQITDHKIAQPAEVLSVGQTVDAEIIGIDEESHKISLSIRSLMERQGETSDAESADDEE